MNRVSSFHTRPLAPAAFMSFEYLNLASVPAVRPKRPLRLGPTLFFPATVLWQALHLAKTFLPFLTSPAAWAGVPVTTASTANAPTARKSPSIRLRNIPITCCRLRTIKAVFRLHVYQRIGRGQAQVQAVPAPPATLSR